MYKQLYILKKTGNYLLLTAALLFCSTAWGLSTDKDQPIEIEANAAELDDQKGVTIYTGNVVVTQGSIRMTGDKMTVYYTRENDLDTVIMIGQPATYRQLPDNSEIYDEAEALRMEFYNLKNLIVLIDNALVKQEHKRFSGNRIEYDTLNSKVWARGAADKTVAEEGDTPATDSGRVKIIIQPKKKE
jgi:lipopolysaccharide export system protein LptA